MPYYDYVCEKCENKQEELAKWDDETPRACSKCGASTKREFPKPKEIKMDIPTC